MSKLILGIILVAALGTACFTALINDLKAPTDATRDSGISTKNYKVIKVIDGDTIEVEIDGVAKKVRYIGIDTPESTQADRSKECFADESTARNRELVEGKWVRLEKDVSETDKYGRLLRYVYVEEEFVNQLLLVEGYANTLSIYPDLFHESNFLEAQNKAQANKIGLWGSECAI